MWIQEPCEINSRLIFLGTRKSSVYLVKGDRYMIVGAGGPWIVQELQRQIDTFRIDMDRVQYLLIGHSHYDHCGAAPYLLKRYPHLKVLASHEAQKLYMMEKAVKNMRNFNRKVMDTINLMMEYDGISLDFDQIRVDRVLHEGDQIDLGGNVKFNIFETPGHSRCAMTLYDPKQKWLFPSDSLHVPVGNGDSFVSTASESFIKYLTSLKKLENLDIDLCAWEHHGVMTGDDAKNIIRRGIKYTLDFKRRIIHAVERSGSRDSVAHWITHDWLDKTDFEFLPYEVMLHVAHGMVRNAVEEKIEEIDWL